MSRSRTPPGASGSDPGDAERRDAPAHPPVGGLAVYYRLRCLALEVQVRRLQAELERAEHEREQVVARYEELLQDRDAPAGAPLTWSD